MVLIVTAAVLLTGGRARAADGIVVSATARTGLPGAARSAHAQRRALEAYWTPRRMRTVVRERAAEAAHAAPGTTAGAAAELPGAAETGPVVDTVGKIFFNHPDGTPDVCSGSAVDTPHETLVLTAAHCLYEGPGGGWMTNVVFVPGYDDGQSPLGLFPAWNYAVDSLWSSEGDPARDYGMIITYDNGQHEHVADAAGGFPVVANQGTVNDVTIVGYPAQAPYDGRHQEYCTDTTEPTAPPLNMIQAYCPAMVGGSSGSPWLLGYDASDQLGYVYGVNDIADGGGYVATAIFDDRTLNFVSLVDQLAAARP